MLTKVNAKSNIKTISNLEPQILNKVFNLKLITLLDQGSHSKPDGVY